VRPYFFSNRPIERAIRLTDPACLPSSAAIFDTRVPRLANLANCCISEPVHSLGLGVLMRGDPLSAAH